MSALASGKFHLKISRVQQVIISIFIFAFSSSPDIFLLSDDRNIFLISLMMLSPFIALATILNSKKIYTLDIYLIIFIAFIFISSVIVNSHSTKWTSILYTLMFILTFIAYEHTLKDGSYSIERYCKLLKFIILVYLYVLIIQQFCVILNIPVFLSGNYNPETPWKLSSISAEPAHAALNLTILLFSYIKMQEILIGRSYVISSDAFADLHIWIAYLWFVFSSNSTSAIFLFFILFSYFLKLKNVLIVIFIGLIFIYLFSYLELAAFERASTFLPALISLDTEAMISADHSASYRFVPALLIMDKVSFFDLNGLFGLGSGYVNSFLYLEMPGTPEGYATGGVMVVWIEYGLLAFLLFIIFSIRLMGSKLSIVSWVLWFSFIFLGNGINTQLVWLFFILMYTNQYFHLKYDSSAGSA